MPLLLAEQIVNTHEAYDPAGMCVLIGGILTDDEYGRIDYERRLSEQAFLEDPHRYYARVRGS